MFALYLLTCLLYWLIVAYLIALNICRTAGPS